MDQGDRPFLAERDTRRDLSSAPPHRIVEPLLRQRELAGQGTGVVRTNQRARHRYVAVGNLAQCAAVRAFDADRVCALLGPPRVVEGHDPAALRHASPQAVPETARAQPSVTSQWYEIGTVSTNTELWIGCTKPWA